jgi:hypothetical protein
MRKKLPNSPFLLFEVLIILFFPFFFLHQHTISPPKEVCADLVLDDFKLFCSPATQFSSQQI